ncbi:MAG: hypothetical protein ACK41T_07680, partial [Pseudobdellovibrio sp.]
MVVNSQLSIKRVLILTLFLGIAACTQKKTTEKIIIQERQASPHLADSLQHRSDKPSAAVSGTTTCDKNSTLLTLKKEALEKAFLLTPTFVISS